MGFLILQTVENPFVFVEHRCQSAENTSKDIVCMEYTASVPSFGWARSNAACPRGLFRAVDLQAWSRAGLGPYKPVDRSLPKIWPG